MKSAWIAAGIFLVAVPASANDVTRAQYERIRIGMAHKRVARIFARKGVRETTVFYAWPRANLRVGFKKDGDISHFEEYKVVDKRSPRYGAFVEAYKKKVVDRGEKLTYRDAVAVMGKPGKKLRVVEYVWRNENGGRVKIEFIKKRVTAKVVLGRLN